MVLTSLIQGVQETMIKNGTALMSGHVNIAGFYKLSQSSASPLVTDFQKLYTLAHKIVPEAELMVDRMKAYGKVISESDSIQVPMWGVLIDTEQSILGPLELESGNLQDLSKRGSIALFSSQAKRLKVQIGDMVTVSMPTFRNVNNTKDVKVVAVLKDLGLFSQFSLFLHSDDVREIFQLKDNTTGQIMIFLPDIKKVDEVSDRLRKELALAGYRIMEKDPTPFFMKFDRIAGESWTGQKIDITTWEDETSFLKWVLQLLKALTFFLVLILMVVVTMGLMNAIWMSIRERTSEIGTLRAIGLKRSQVFVMILLESLMLAFASTAVGGLFGFVLAKFLDFLHLPIKSEALQIFFMSNYLHFSAQWSDFFLVLTVLVLALSVGAIIPTRSAAKLKPVTAMQT
jgi:ABC-type lipoprotein release transport system permease subunit